MIEISKIYTYIIYYVYIYYIVLLMYFVFILKITNYLFNLFMIWHPPKPNIIFIVLYILLSNIIMYKIK